MVVPLPSSYVRKRRLNKNLTKTFFILLKKWRQCMLEDEIKSGKRPSFETVQVIVENKTIMNLAYAFPTTLAELKSIEGLSKEKISDYGVLLEKVFVWHCRKCLINGGGGESNGLFFLWAARLSFFFVSSLFIMSCAHSLTHSC
jgi:hypothetical protein